MSFNFPVTTKNVLLSINLRLAVKFPRQRLFILVVFSKENKHSERIAEAIMSPTDPNKFKRGINPKKKKNLSIFIHALLAQDQYPAKFLGFWLVTILFNNRIE